MIDYFEQLADVLMNWSNGGCKEANGARLICRVPHVAPTAWLHQLFAGLADSQLLELEKQLCLPLPTDFKDFLRNTNGIHAFSDTISIWGMRNSFERSGDNAYQPYDLVSLNQERPMGCPPSWLFFGSYSWDGSRMFFDLGNDSGKVYRSERRTTKVLNEWTDFGTWLTNEIERVSLLFDEIGRKYDKRMATIPLTF